MRYLDAADPLAVSAAAAVRLGDLDGVRRLLAGHPGLARVRLGEAGGVSRTLLHVLTDWPGHVPRGPALVRELVAAGAEVDARFAGPHAETPLTWAASCDDVPVLDALLDAGADVEATGAVIGGGTALSDACAFAQWDACHGGQSQAAAFLLERGGDLGWVGYDDLTPLDAARRAGADDLASWLAAHGARPGPRHPAG
ncbi:hypothetical protein AB0J71_43420 [Nonomuraea sp. NPDC049637]|uniref:ankyrin repeat domain-containing protein n=1 Tax=Nonomuraea sp. NPDC049637 TaxID=3154356 RepID=UPI00341E0458